MAKIQDFSENEQAIAYLVAAGVYGNWMITPLPKSSRSGVDKTELAFGKIIKREPGRISPICFYVGAKDKHKNKILNGYHVILKDAGIDENEILADYMEGKEALSNAGQRVCQAILSKRKKEQDRENIAAANNYRWNSLIMDDSFGKSSGFSAEYLDAINEEIGKGIGGVYQELDGAEQAK